MQLINYKEKLVLQDIYEALLMLDLAFPSSVRLSYRRPATVE